MQVSVSKAGKLGRKLSVTVPEEKIEEQQNKRYKKLAKTVKMDGFRKGKVPLNVIAERYGAQVRQEILGDVIQSSLIEALTQEKLNPAGMPNITETIFEEGKPLSYVAEFEVYPEISIKPFSKLKIEKLTAEVADEDLDKTLQTILGQYKEWSTVERAAKDGDQVDVNFVGSLDGVEFDGGKADNFKLELGTKKMIPGFEEGVVGMKAGEEKNIKVTFPENYGQADLAGKEADFKITANHVEESSLPAVDDALAEKLGIKEGGVDKLKAEIRKNMQRELDNALKNEVKKNAMDALVEKNDIEIPRALIDSEIDRMQKEAEKMYGKHASMDGIMDKSNDVFEKEAKRRVSLGLLVSDIIKKNEMKVDAAKVRTTIEDIADAYEKPEEVVAMYYNDKQRLAGMEALVLEDMVIDKILADAKVSEKKSTFSEIIKPQQ